MEEEQKGSLMALSMRKVRFPLKLKLLSLMIVLIAASLIVFVGIALSIFREDKSAYIYETLMNKASSEQIILSQKLLSVDSSSLFIKDGELSREGANPIPVVNEQIGETTIFKTKIVILEQNRFFQYASEKISPVDPVEEKVLEGITQNSLNHAVKEITLNDQKILYAYDYNPLLNYAFVVSLSQEDAFAVTTYLVNKSTYYGLFILGVAMLLSVLLTKPLTAQLENLFAMTQELAKGNFETRVKIKGHDEVGALSDSVNDMADKIVIFMKEMKEKARLENEVQVAQLVQSSFFPANQLPDEVFSTFGHFEPASECGGDWWGIYDKGDWRVFFIADATGHGVPAALLTATINCCKTSLSFITESNPEILSKPNEILRYMNQAVCGAGKEIQVTCFVASFNRVTREFVYSNSSQTPPLLFNSQGEELSKDNFQPLNEANGPRLGQNPNALFESKHHKLKTHDTIFFYTDGLTEAENTEGQRWGERRLIKSLVENGISSPEKIVKGVMNDFQTFTSNVPINDDITAVAMKVIT